MKEIKITLTDTEASLIMEALNEKVDVFQSYVENNTIRKWKKLRDDFYDKIKEAR